MSAAITTPPEAPTRSRLERVRQQLLSRADSLPTVAALVIFAGTLVVRGVFGIPVLAPEDAGYLGVGVWQDEGGILYWVQLFAKE